MSNLRQMSNYMVMYSSENRDFILPGNAIQSRYEAGDWYGIIARLYFKANLANPANGDFLYGSAAIDALSKTGMDEYLSCPSTVMPPYNPAAPYSNGTVQTETPIKWSYIYNRSFGDWDKLMQYPVPTVDQRSQYAMKKRGKSPGAVIALADFAPYLPNGRGANGSRFFTFTREVNPLHADWATLGGLVGAPHGSQSTPKTNILLLSGEVLSIQLKKMNDVPNKYLVDGRDWADGATTRRVQTRVQHGF